MRSCRCRKRQDARAHVPLCQARDVTSMVFIDHISNTRLPTDGDNAYITIPTGPFSVSSHAQTGVVFHRFTGVGYCFKDVIVPLNPFYY